MKPLPVIQPHTDSSASPEPRPEQQSSSSLDALQSDAERTAALEPQVVAALKTVYDPEIPVNIHDLGLIYDVIVDAASTVGVRMTLTAPNCPAAQILPGQVEQAVRHVDGVSSVIVDVVFDPPWDRERMSDAAKLQLGLW